MGKLSQRKIRVLFEVSPYIIGGTERFLFNLLAHLDRNTIDPILVSWANGKTVQLGKRLALDIRVIPYHDLADGQRYLCRFLKQEKVQLVQSNYFSPFLGNSAKILSIPHLWRVGGHIEIVSDKTSPQHKKAHVEQPDQLTERRYSAMLSR